MKNSNLIVFVKLDPFYQAFRAFRCRNTWNALISSRSFHPWSHLARGPSPRRNSAIQTKEKIQSPVFKIFDWWRINEQRKNKITFIGQEIHKKNEKKKDFREEVRRRFSLQFLTFLIDESQWTNQITFNGQRRSTYQQNNLKKTIPESGDSPRHLRLAVTMRKSGAISKQKRMNRELRIMMIRFDNFFLTKGKKRGGGTF